MLELTYLILLKQSELEAIKHEDVTSFFFKNPDNGEMELHVPVDVDTTNKLTDYLTRQNSADIHGNNVALIRFYA